MREAPKKSQLLYHEEVWEQNVNKPLGRALITHCGYAAGRKTKIPLFKRDRPVLTGWCRHF